MVTLTGHIFIEPTVYIISKSVNLNILLKLETNFVQNHPTDEEFSLVTVKMKFFVLLAVVAVIGGSWAEEKKEKEKEMGTVIGIDLGTTYSW